MKKQSRRLSNLVRRLKSAPVLVATVLFMAGGVSMAVAHADTLQQQIDKLNAQNAQKQNSVSNLQLQASSYQDAINKLQLQIAGIQKQIFTSQAKQAQLQSQINDDQVKLDQQKKVLGEDIKAMYVGGQLTAVEMLATSKNLSSFVDAETYDGAVQNKIQDTLKQITKLQNKLEDQKTQVDQLLNIQTSQQERLTADQAQQNNLLAMNQSQQTQYNQQIHNNNARVQKLQAELAAQLRALGGSTYYGGTGSYPWANAPCPIPGGGPTCGNYDWAYPTGPVPLGAPVGPFDPWGYEYRNCTSYVAWKIDSLSASPIIGSLISGLGNAADWPGNAQVPHTVGYGARYGDAAVVPGVAEGQGHVMFVEHVNGDGTIDVSQYNAGVPGVFSQAYDVRESGLIFVHFPGM